MYCEQRFITDAGKNNYAVIIEADNSDAICIVMPKEQVFKMKVELVNIPFENICIYGDYKCIFFSGNLFIININTLKISTIPKIKKVFYLDTGMFAISEKPDRYDSLVKIDLNDFFVEHIGRFKHRDMIR